MPDADAFASPPLRRPRIIGDTLILGQTTVLARRAVVNGCWMLRQPNAAVLAALLSVAYEQPIAADDRLTRTVLRAIAQMPRNPRESEQSLSDLPDPCAAPETLELAARLLASGTRPEALAQAMRRAPLALPVMPLCANNLTLCEKGVVLGQTVVIPLADRPGGATGLDLAGREGRILALLSIGRLGVVPPETLGKLHAASAALERGEAVLAVFHLALLGQPPLPHRNIVKALDLAVAQLDGGFPPYDLLKALELLPQGMRAGDWRRLVKYRPDQLRDDHGRWAEEGGSQSSVIPVRHILPTPWGAKDSPVFNRDSPEKIRQTVAGIARGYEGSKNWMYADPHGNVKGSKYKCNVFIADVLDQAGIPVGNLHDTWTGEAKPTAGDWANPDFKIPGWEVVELAPNERPQAGDIVAEAHWWSDLAGVATGHVGIIVEKDGEIRTASVSATDGNGGKITLSDWGLRSEDRGEIVVRRYVGPGRAA